MTYEDIQRANATIRTTDIKGKEYAEVPQRVKAFRMLYPTGFITTQLLSNEGEPGKRICVFKAEVGVGTTVLGTGTAYECESTSYINKTSYIENCETSAVGRALGFAGLGIDTSIASAEEVQNAINQQNNTTRAPERAVKQPVAEAPEKPTAKVTIENSQATVLRVALQQTGQTEEKMLAHYGKERIEDLTAEEYIDAMERIKKWKERKRK